LARKARSIREGPSCPAIKTARFAALQPFAVNFAYNITNTLAQQTSANDEAENQSTWA
jgi:hypothetical protein